MITKREDGWTYLSFEGWEMYAVTFGVPVLMFAIGLVVGAVIW